MDWRQNRVDLDLKVENLIQQAKFFSGWIKTKLSDGTTLDIMSTQCDVAGDKTIGI